MNEYRKSQGDEMRAIGYLRVSTTEQAASGLGLDAQAERVTGEIRARGWTLTETITDDGYSAKDLKRPGIARALEMLANGQADALVVSKLDRLSRSVFDFTGLLERAKDEGWTLVALDLGVDTSTPSGEMMASVLMAFAQYERRLIGQRTKDALAVLKGQGVRLGAPVTLPQAVRGRVVRERSNGATLQAIADGLNSDEVPTARGGACWYPSTVSAVLQSVSTDEEIEAIRSAAA